MTADETTATGHSEAWPQVLSTQEDFLKVEQARLKLGVDAVLGAIRGDVNPGEHAHLQELVHDKPYTVVRKLANKFQKIAELLEIDIYITPEAQPTTKPMPAEPTPLITPPPKVEEAPTKIAEVQPEPPEIPQASLPAAPHKEQAPKKPENSTRALLERLFATNPQAAEQLDKLDEKGLELALERVCDLYIGSKRYPGAAEKRMQYLKDHVAGMTDAEIAQKYDVFTVPSTVAANRSSSVDSLIKLKPSIAILETAIVRQSVAQPAPKQVAKKAAPKIVPKTPEPTAVLRPELLPEDQLKDAIRQLGDQLGMDRKIKDALIHRFSESTTQIHITREARMGLEALATKYDRQMQTGRLKLEYIEAQLFTKLINRDERMEGTIPLSTIIQKLDAELKESGRSTAEILTSVLTKILQLHKETAREQAAKQATRSARS